MGPSLTPLHTAEFQHTPPPPSPGHDATPPVMVSHPHLLCHPLLPRHPPFHVPLLLCPHQVDTHEPFKQCVAAYEVLMDEQRRAEYDRERVGVRGGVLWEGGGEGSLSYTHPQQACHGE